MQQNLTSQQFSSKVWLYDRPLAAELLSISLRKLDALIARGDLAPVRIDGRVLLSPAELQRFIELKSIAVLLPRELLELQRRATAAQLQNDPQRTAKVLKALEVFKAALTENESFSNSTKKQKQKKDDSQK